MSEKVIPLFPCESLTETLVFYQALGFDVTYQQDDPYLYAVIIRDEIELHFSKLTTWHTKNSVCMVFVSQVSTYHRKFADALRAKYGKVPTAGLPRITRLRKGQTRFHLFDPSGNVLLFINQEEPEMDYGWYGRQQSALAYAINNAAFLRDTYVNDEAAVKVLEKALAAKDTVDPVDRARALAALAELLVAMGQGERAHAVQQELQLITLSDEDRDAYEDELDAPINLERWLVTNPRK